MANQKNTISEKIKKLREEKELSIAEVAERAGLPEDMLVAFEQHNNSLSLGSIIRLAKAFNVPVGSLFGENGESPFSIVRVEDRAMVSRFGSSRDESCGYSYQSLGQNKRNRHMEPFLVTLNPAEAHEAKANDHVGEEFLYVLEGQVEVILDDYRDVLKPGDSIYYDSDVPHIVRCLGDKPATILAVIHVQQEMIIF
jgi:transcriptional regulator with XRE-family HTH domain